MEESFSRILKGNFPGTYKKKKLFESEKRMDNLHPLCL